MDTRTYDGRKFGRAATPPIHTVGIRSVLYTVASDADTIAESRAVVANQSMLELGLPKPLGVFDANMGTTSSAYVCATCHLGKEKCHGHPGHFRLNYPCLVPIYIQETKKWLKIICFHCGNLIISDDDARAMLRRVRASERLDYIVKHLSNQRRNCAVCGLPHAIVKRPDKTKYSFIVRDQTSDGSPVDIPLYPHDIAVIFSRVRDETIIRLGRNVLSGPSRFVSNVIYIPPPAIRPDTKKQGSRGSGNDSITSRLKDLISHHNSEIKPSIPHEIDPKLAAKLNTFNAILADIHIKGTDRSKSIAMRLKSKHGHMRENLLGRRVFGMGRSTIDGSPRLNLDQISIPLFIAQTLQIEETIQDFNRERLAVFVANGTARYPGCSRILKRGGGVFKPDAAGLQLENGDVILRDLINGDIVAFNRQPTLTLSNITSVRIVVDKTALANGMSVLICPLFNADFDGDQMNIFNYARVASLVEQFLMTNVASRMVSATTGSMSIGQSGDSLIGLMKLTQPGVILDKYHACLIFSSTNCAPRLEQYFAGRATIDGRDIVSMSLARTPISYRGKSDYYNPDKVWMRFMPQVPEAATIEIVGGKLLRGCLDKPSIGDGSSSIYQIMVHEFGPQRTLDVIYDMQQVGINFISQHGFTTGIQDFRIDPEQKLRIARTSQGTMTKALQIVDQLNRGQIIPPIDKTIMQFYEEKQINAQRVVDDYHEPVIRSIVNPRSNGVFEMMAVGKGSPTFLVNMVATVGLIMISGERVRANFGFGRTLPYFQRFEESPEARGYSESSFIEGLSLVGCIYNAMMARTDIISRALMTSVTGDQNRKSIKSLESIITNNYRMTLKNRDIVSFVYGGDYFDPRSLENVSYGPALISNAELARRYKFSAANPSQQPMFDEEFARIEADRAEFRRIFKTIEDLSVRDKMGSVIKLPFNIARLAERLCLAIRNDAIGAMVEGTPTAKAIDALGKVADTIADATQGPKGSADAEYVVAAKMVAQFCDDAPYLFINEEQRRKKGWVPEFTASAATLLRFYVRAELCTVRLRELRKQCPADVRLVAFVYALLEGIASIVMTSLIDPGLAVGIIAAQSFSEPFTQAMLDSYKTSALTGGNVGRTKMSKCREIMNAYDVDRLSNPMMTIVLDTEHASSVERAQEVAQSIEMLRFSQLTARRQIFYEKFGEPVHPQYAEERAMFAQFAADNPLLQPPGDLAAWCMRFEVDKSVLVQKNISMHTIITRLRDRYSDLYLVYTTERAPRVIIRAYVRSSGLDKFAIQTNESETHATRRKGVRRSPGSDMRIRDVFHTILATIVRGVDGILLTKVEKMIRTRVADDGAVVDDVVQYGIRTNGTNMVRVACIPGVRANMIQTDAVQELAHVLGIEAARYRIITEMRGLIEKCNVRHYMIYADEMTRTGRVTSIERGGLSIREANNVALRAGQAAPVQVFTEAAINARRDVLSGVSGPLIFGAIPRIGTLYNSFMIDPEVIKKYKKSAKDVLEDL